MKDEYFKKYVSDSLTDLKNDHKILRKEFGDFSKAQNNANLKIFTAIASLKTKVGVWGLIGGGLAAAVGVPLVTALINYLSK